MTWENYSKYLFKKYHLENVESVYTIHFLNRMTREKQHDAYTDCPVSEQSCLKLFD